MNNKAAILLAIACLPVTPLAFAGLTVGHYVVWMNLAENQARYDKNLTSYLAHADQDCWDHDSILYMRSRPSEITPSLVAKAMLKNDAAAIRTLSKALEQPFGEAKAGFDGIVVYTDQPKPRMFGLTAGRRKVDSQVVEAPDEAEPFGIAFCNMMPAIVRKP